MSKKDRERNKDAKNTPVDKDDEASKIRQEMETTPIERKIMSIIGIVAIIGIIIIVLFNIPWGGEKERIARKYNIDKDNVFEYIEFDELREKIINCEEFHVLFVDKSQENALDYVFYTDLVVKSMNEDPEIPEIKTVYLFNTVNLSKEKYKDQAKYIKDHVEKNVLSTPNLVYFKKPLARDYSTANNTTSRYQLSEYSNNVWRMVLDYFYNCYEED